MPKHAKYDMPSGERIEFDLSQIEGPLRRKKKNKEWKVMVVGLIVLLGLLFALLNHFLPLSHAEAMESVIVAPTGFCAQAERDLETWARQASPELKEYCNNIK